jgi:hypothetical protein
VVGLPDAATLNQAYFETKVLALVDRFKEQVMAVNDQQRPLKVVTARGVRHALVKPETMRNSDLHGEWRNAPTRTGRWTFVRWIDDDMSAMAVGHATTYDANAALAIRTPADGTFWSTESLRALAEEHL